METLPQDNGKSSPSFLHTLVSKGLWHALSGYFGDLEKGGRRRGLASIPLLLTALLGISGSSVANGTTSPGTPGNHTEAGNPGITGAPGTLTFTPGAHPHNDFRDFNRQLHQTLLSDNIPNDSIPDPQYISQLIGDNMTEHNLTTKPGIDTFIDNMSELDVFASVDSYFAQLYLINLKGLFYQRAGLKLQALQVYREFGNNFNPGKLTELDPSYQEYIVYKSISNYLNIFRESFGISGDMTEILTDNVFYDHLKKFTQYVHSPSASLPGHIKVSYLTNLLNMGIEADVFDKEITNEGGYNELRLGIGGDNANANNSITFSNPELSADLTTQIDSSFSLLLAQPDTTFADFSDGQLDQFNQTVHNILTQDATISYSTDSISLSQLTASLKAGEDLGPKASKTLRSLGVYYNNLAIHYRNYSTDNGSIAKDYQKIAMLLKGYGQIPGLEDDESSYYVSPENILILLQTSDPAPKVPLWMRAQIFEGKNIATVDASLYEDVLNQLPYIFYHYSADEKTQLTQMLYKFAGGQGEIITNQGVDSLLQHLFDKIDGDEMGNIPEDLENFFGEDGTTTFQPKIMIAFVQEILEEINEGDLTALQQEIIRINVEKTLVNQKLQNTIEQLEKANKLTKEQKEKLEKQKQELEHQNEQLEQQQQVILSQNKQLKDSRLLIGIFSSAFGFLLIFGIIKLLRKKQETESGGYAQATIDKNGKVRGMSPEFKKLQQRIHDDNWKNIFRENVFEKTKKEQYSYRIIQTENKGENKNDNQDNELPEGTLKDMCDKVLKDKGKTKIQYVYPTKDKNKFPMFLQTTLSYHKGKVVMKVEDISELEKKKKELVELQNKTQAQKEKLAEINKALQDSIRYAQRLQFSFLKKYDNILEKIQDEYPNFTVFKPRDVLSGDFYYVADDENYTTIMAADCTGHGVPGALLSIYFMQLLEQNATSGKTFFEMLLNNSDLTQKEKNTFQELLQKLRHQSPAVLLKTLKQFITQSFGEDTKDGMDAAVIRIKKDDRSIEYEGAKNDLYFVAKESDIAEIDQQKDTYKIETITKKDGKEKLEKLEKNNLKKDGNRNLLITFPAGKSAIGKPHDKQTESFVNKLLPQCEGAIYIFSDGFQDQFGGEKGRKFMKGKFKKLLLEIADKPMKEQKIILEFVNEAWKRGHPLEKILGFIKKDKISWLSMLCTYWSKGKGKKPSEQIDDILVMGIKIQ